MKYIALLPVLICISLFTGYNSYAQQYIFKKYTVEDGLVANPVRRIYQDSKGFIWIGTWEGLSKYDGHKFTNYTIANGLSHNLVNDMYESDDGKLYIAENNGSIDILEHDAFVKKLSLPKIVINRFNKIKNQGLIATTDINGLYEIRNGVLSKPKQSFPDSTYHELEELNDSLLIGGSEGDLKILNRQYQLFSKIKSPWRVVVYKIFKDTKKNVWLGTSFGLKQVLTSQKKGQPAVFYLMDAPFRTPVLKNKLVNDLLEDTNGNLWIATTHGLVKIDPNGYEQLFVEKDGLPSAYISCIYQDKEKNIWIGTSLGLAKLVTKNEIRVYTVEDRLSSKGFAFLLPIGNDEFLTSNEAGIQLYNSRIKQFYTVRSQHNLFYTGFVQNSKPILFFRNNSSFGKFDSVHRKITDYTWPGPSPSVVYCSIIDKNGIIFNGTIAGLVICAGGVSYYENEFKYRITDMLIDKKGYLWLATWSNGLFRIRTVTKENKSGSIQISLSVKDFSYLLPDKSIRCLFEDSKGNIWVGSRYQGIVQFSNRSDSVYALRHIDVQKGIMSNWVTAISEDVKGNVWVGSNLGIDKLILFGNTFRVFNFSRVINYFAHINAILPANNSLWLTTRSGLINITDEETEKTPPHRVYITSVNLGDTSFKYSSHSSDTRVNLKYHQNQAEFKFSAPGFINEKQNLYSYRLSGSADTSWSNPSNVHNVSYASLQPGNYKFEVRSIGWNDEWGQPENFSFSIQPPYWKRWWFYSLVALLLLILFYAFYLYRIRQLLRLQNVRNRIASDLHDDIGSTLTNISILSELSDKNLYQPQQAKKYLQRITEEVNTSSQALDDIIWSVNSNNDTLDEMLVRMRRFAAELFDHTLTSCTLELQPEAASKKLGMEQRRDVYLVYKESLNNIYKHAAAQQVWVELSMTGHRLKLTIRDDGKGFNPEAITHRNGLNNLKTRVEKWKGKLMINSHPGKGSHIEIVMPVAS